MRDALIGGRFRLDRMLGAGTMGQVWLATDERLQRSVAVKVVIPDNIDDSTVQRLEREARAAAAVQHANVVRVFDYLEDGGRTLIIMEYVEGETLADRIARTGPMQFDEAVELTAQVCDGLEAAHRLKLVHRDLKPANVILTDEGLAKILDFGIAKRTGHTEATLTQTGAVLGTPQYMAPEQLGGEEIDARVDVHAAGLLLYEMLSGKSAFGGGTIAQLMFQLVSDPPDLTVLTARGVPEDVIAIVACALQKNRDDRWPTARMMAEALRIAIYGEVVMNRRTPTPSGLRTISASNLRITNASQTATPLASTVIVPADRSLSTLLMRAQPRTRRLAIGSIAATAVVAALFLSKVVGANGPGPARAQAAADSLRRDSLAAAATRDSASRAAASKTATPESLAATEKSPELLAEDALRRAVTATLQEKWRLFGRQAENDLGAQMTRLRTEVLFQVEPSGSVTDVRPGQLSNVAAFDNLAFRATQEVQTVRVGAARSPGGWLVRASFIGKAVRIRLTPRR